MATWHGDLSRKGPGLLLNDLSKGAVALEPILATHPDVLLLTDVDFDAGLVALNALRKNLSDQGLVLPFYLALRPNAGMPTGLDLDGDGRLGGPADAQGFGFFSGQGGMAVLSRYPLGLAKDLSGLLWADTPQSRMTPDDPAHDIQRLSSRAHWAVRVNAPEPFTLLTLAATPPVFDGPEDRNGRRNADEVALWLHALDGRLDWQPDTPVILLGLLNIDPHNGEGQRAVARAALAHPRLQDPQPEVKTVAWDSTGPMRVSYVLPDTSLRVTGSGVSEVTPDAGPHRLVWIDLDQS